MKCVLKADDPCESKRVPEFYLNPLESSHVHFVRNRQKKTKKHLSVLCRNQNAECVKVVQGAKFVSHIKGQVYLCILLCCVV